MCLTQHKNVGPMAEANPHRGHAAPRQSCKLAVRHRTDPTRTLAMRDRMHRGAARPDRGTGAVPRIQVVGPTRCRISQPRYRIGDVCSNY